MGNLFVHDCDAEVDRLKKELNKEKKNLMILKQENALFKINTLKLEKEQLLLKESLISIENKLKNLLPNNWAQTCALIIKANQTSHEIEINKMKQEIQFVHEQISVYKDYQHNNLKQISQLNKILDEKDKDLDFFRKKIYNLESFTSEADILNIILYINKFLDSYNSKMLISINSYKTYFANNENRKKLLLEINKIIDSNFFGINDLITISDEYDNFFTNESYDNEYHLFLLNIFQMIDELESKNFT